MTRSGTSHLSRLSFTQLGDPKVGRKLSDAQTNLRA